MSLGPFYLPGGKAMVRTIGGEKKFIIDADECCCETTTAGPTTTAPPGTTTPPPTTTTGEPALSCPSLDWAQANCPDTLFAYMSATGCNGNTDCSGTWTLNLKGFGPFGLEAQWEADDIWKSDNCFCRSYLRCHAIAPFSWRIGVAAWCSPHGRLGYCTWSRPLYVDDCPMGVYSTLVSEYLCECSASVVVYS